MYGDPAHLDEIALSLDDRAEAVRARAGELVARAESVHWFSTAADRMRERAREMAAALGRVAQNYQEAAEAVRSHARAVRRALAFIEAIERAVTRAVEAAKDRLSEFKDWALGGVEDFVDGVGNLFGVGGDEPDPADVELANLELPPPGDVAWLDHAARAGMA